MSSLLLQIRQLVTVDVDSMDVSVATRHAMGPAGGAFCDMTSNQAIASGEMMKPENVQLVEDAIKIALDNSPNAPHDDLLEDVLDIITVLLAKRIYPYLTGNVHAQTSPSTAYSTEKTVAHAKRLVALFTAQGIPKERVCIKIPCTSESMVACRRLSDIGIQTLGTCLFSVHQALAASQASCLYIAPYYNELRVHFERSLWKDYKNPTTEHPMSPVIRSITQLFKDIGSKTLVMPASIVTPAEVIALVSLKPDHLTISGGVLDELARLPAVSIDSFRSPEPEPVEENLKDIDYLADGGEKLREALSADQESSRKLADALALFGQCEQKSREFLKPFIAKA